MDLLGSWEPGIARTLNKQVRVAVICSQEKQLGSPGQLGDRLLTYITKTSKPKDFTYKSFGPYDVQIPKLSSQLLLRNKSFFWLSGQVHKEVRAAGAWSSWSHPQPGVCSLPCSIVCSPGGVLPSVKRGLLTSVKVIKLTSTGCLLGNSRLRLGDSTVRRRSRTRVQGAVPPRGPWEQ